MVWAVRAKHKDSSLSTFCRNRIDETNGNKTLQKPVLLDEMEREREIERERDRDIAKHIFGGLHDE